MAEHTIIIETAEAVANIDLAEASPIDVSVTETGPQGPVGGSLRYQHTQAQAAAIWAITHNLGARPFAVMVTDSAGDDVIGDVVHIDDNSLQIRFSAAFSGVAVMGA